MYCEKGDNGNIEWRKTKKTAVVGLNFIQILA